MNEITETATLGTGCFWCTEAVFSRLNGVMSVTSGYSGGATMSPDYELVCSGTTGHAECIQIIFNPLLISYEKILEVFWNTHDPTTLNRQGNDIGTQYRSVVFYHNEKQKEIASLYKHQLDLSGIFSKPIVTTVEPMVAFYPAEIYHQQYYESHKTAVYCQFVVRPKVEKFKKQFAILLKP